MACWGLLPLLSLMLFVIALEASSSPSSYTPTHRQSLSHLHSRVNRHTVISSIKKRETSVEPDETTNLESEPEDPPSSNGNNNQPRFKDPPRVDSITADSVKVLVTPWTPQTGIGQKPPGSQLSYVLQFWNGWSETPAKENVTFKKSQQGYAHKFSNLTLGTVYTFSDLAPDIKYTLSGLAPNTSYHVQVRVMVNNTSTADGEDVKTKNFTTCPDPPKPEDLEVPPTTSSKKLPVKWSVDVSYPERCDLRYRVRVQKWKGSYILKDDTTEKVEYTITDLQPYTTYLVMVLSMIGEKYSNLNAINVTTLPDKPGKVTNLKKEDANGTSLLVTWDNSTDGPLKGELESFRVSWDVTDVTTGNNYKNVRLQNKYLITNLEPNTTYTIKVKGKNKDVKQFGDKSEITATTTLGVPQQVGVIKYPNATLSWLTVSWQPPNNDTGITTFYNVSLWPAAAAAAATDSPKRNKHVYITHAEFDGLAAETNYTAQVQACNNETCGETVEGNVWTRPAHLHFQEGGVDFGEATETTMVVQLPLLSNPPGWHYVMVQRKEKGVEQSSELEKKLMDAAFNLVKNDNYQQTRKRRSVDSAKMYIAAKLQQVDDKRLEVTLGDDKTYGGYHNQPLENNADYWTLVVTEKRSGSWTEPVCSAPRAFVAAPNNTFEGLGLAAGMAVVLLVIAALAIVCIKKRHRMRLKLTKDRIVNNYPLATLRGDPYFLPLEQCNKWEGESSTLERKKSCPAQVSQNLTKEDIYANSTMLVPKQDLEAYLLRAVLSAETKAEFAKVPTILSSNTSASSLPENRIKNRYRMNVTYDETRVVLPLHDNIPHSDYINANFIEGPGRRDAFIATQGPKKETIGAFWRMVWHTQSSAIVMVAKLSESGKDKVTQYWPERQTQLAEGLTVTPGSVTSTMDFVIRIFILSDGSTQRQVTHYQYIAWPDHGVPQMAYGLANMLKKVRRNHDDCYPITVHCSAGIGRTGTVILVLYLLEQLKTGSELNPMTALSTMRHGRGRLVENIDQYIFAHQVLNEILFGLDTSFPCHSFDKKLSAIRSPQAPNDISPLQQQFKKLKSLPKDMSFKYGKDPAVANLNRNKAILPADCRLLFVPSLTPGLESRYLNVVRINGADMKDAYIAGEHPQTHTLARMWSLVHEREISVWLMMHDFPGDDLEFPQVVCDSPLLQNMTLTASEPRSLDHYKEQEVDISLFSLGKVRKHKCVLLTLKGWPADHNLPASPRPLISLIERTLASPKYKQILITCRDGVTGCGVAAALLVAIGHTKLTQEVDLYKAAASVMNDRPEFIVNEDQYDFLHQAMNAFLSNERLYSNFN